MLLVAAVRISPNGGVSMQSAEKRRHARIQTKNLFTQESMDEQGHCLSQGICKALDVSQSGLKLESPHPIEGYLVCLMTVDLDDQIIEIIGEPLYCRQVEKGKYHCGIQFIGSEDEIREFAVKLVKLHHHRKHSTFVQVAA
jgi:hypothetical protein